MAESTYLSDLDVMESLNGRMERPSAYIPMDRRLSLIRQQTMPDQVEGAALFADISGFTPLTEILLRALGPQRGAEELSRYLNLVYDALITELHQYGGSVISFSGDAITCWLDQDDGLRATACAFAMQKAMAQFTTVLTPTGETISLAMKTAVATGSARRFLVGDPNQQLIDVLAGSLLDDLARAEKCAGKGEVVLTTPTLKRLEQDVAVARWCIGANNGRHAIISKLNKNVPHQPWENIPINTFNYDQIRGWLLPAVLNRLQSGQGEFLAELRPAVALFLRFAGIDYDQEKDSGEKLDTFIQRIQEVLSNYDGNLLQLTIGDKGSMLYAAFGAPQAHEDDAIRAVSAAFELQALSQQLDFITDVEIGISEGRMRTGAYGSTMRRTYGVLGDDVNLAARLMQLANPGEILVSKGIHQATNNSFTWHKLPKTAIKGKSKPIRLFKALGKRKRKTSRLQKPHYKLPMVGREKELKQIEAAFAPVLQGKGQIIHISGEAGIGKSRLVAEIVRRASERKINVYGGECQSYGTKSSYLVWQRVWQGVFDINLNSSQTKQIAQLSEHLKQLDAALISRLPLLNPLLKLPIPDNELTRSFDAKLRKSSLESMLSDSLRISTQNQPLLIILEDCHWLDPLSTDLLAVIGRAIADRPVLIVVVTRPLADMSEALPISNFPYYSEIPLSEFTLNEADQLIKLKLAQFFGTDTIIPSEFITSITARAEGNPFYIEELLNYLDTEGITPQDMRALTQFQLPSSLHSLILSRIDQLSESQKSTLKVASVVGRLFKAAMLWGAYPQFGEEKVKLDLIELSRLDLTPLDRKEPEITYLFKNVIMQEVAYESLPYATREMIHGLIGNFIESNAVDAITQSVDLLAYHFERSNNDEKTREYLLKAGEAAQANYANTTAIEYFRRLLHLLNPAEQISVKLKLGQVYELVGKWDAASKTYTDAQILAKELDDRLNVGKTQTSLGELHRKRGMYEEAGFWLKQAQSNFELLDDKVGMGQVLHIAGTIAAQQGDLETARIRYEDSLAIRRELNDLTQIGGLLNNLGIVARYQGDYKKARTLYEESLAIRRELGDRRTIAVSLNNLGNVALDQKDYKEARMRLEEAVVLQREVGDKAYIANALNNLGNVIRAQGKYETARRHYHESLELLQELGDKWSLAYLLEDIGCLAAQELHAKRAFILFGAASRLREEIGAPHSSTEEKKYKQLLLPVLEKTDNSKQNAWQTAGMELSLNEAITFAFSG
ncbi:MAG: tetratricopeptide repeat protein [Chloroflexi bacterium]|nr:tetratricopeptide repeat protein [Chloroflexota bacterium]